MLLTILRWPLLMVLGLPEPVSLFGMVFLGRSREAKISRCTECWERPNLDAISFVVIPMAAQANALAFSSIEKDLPTIFLEITRVPESPPVT